MRNVKMDYNIYEINDEGRGTSLKSNLVIHKKSN